MLFSEAKFEHTIGEKYCKKDFVVFLIILWLGFVVLLALPPLRANDIDKKQTLQT